MSRWLRLFFGLLALFGPAAFPVEAAARPVVVTVGGSTAAPVAVGSRPLRGSAEAPEWPQPLAPSDEPTGHARPLYLVHRALLR